VSSLVVELHPGAPVVTLPLNILQTADFMELLSDLRGGNPAMPSIFPSKISMRKITSEYVTSSTVAASYVRFFSDPFSHLMLKLVF